MSVQMSLTPRAWAELILLAAIWGASFLSIRVALDEVGVATVVAHRVFWAALVLWAVVAIRRAPVPRDPAVWGAFLVMGILNNVIPFSLMAWGQLTIATGLTSILNAATAIFGVALAAAILPDERLTARKALGVTLGFAGVVVAVGPGSLAALDVTSLAQLAVLGGALSYGIAGIWARLRLRGHPPEIAAAGMLTGSALVMVPAAWAIDGAPSLALAPDTVLAIGYYSVVATAGAYLLYYRVIAMAGAGNLLLCTLLVAPVAILLGWAVLGERLEPRAYLGFAVLAAGLLVIGGGRRRPAAAAGPDPLAKPAPPR